MRVSIFLVLVVCACSRAEPGKVIGHPSLGVTFELLAMAQVPGTTEVGGMRFGGISGLAYDPARGVWVAISDDSKTHEALIDLDVSLEEDDRGALRLSVEPVRRWGIETGSRDGEGIAIAPDDGELFVVYESNTSAYRFDADANKMIALDVPEEVRTGTRKNKSFESCTFRATDMGDELWIATEEAVEADGEIATTEHGSRCRVLVYDPITYELQVQAIYETEPVPKNIGGFAINSLSEFCAMPDQRVVALERSFVMPMLHGIRLFLVTGGLDAGDEEPATLTKLPIGSLKDLGVLLPGNFEAIECGPAMEELSIEGGGFFVLLASDDNFGRYGEVGTQFIALRARHYQVVTPQIPIGAE